MKPSRSAVFALIALFVAGLGAAGLASGAAKRRTHRVTPHYARIAPACAISVVLNPKTGAVRSLRDAAKDAPSPAPVPSKQLLAAFGVLRRDHADEDNLPAGVVAELRARGASFDPQTARLLRSTAGGGKAWIVPVSDVHALDSGPGCGPFYRVAPSASKFLPVLPRTLRPRVATVPTLTTTAPKPVPVPTTPLPTMTTKAPTTPAAVPVPTATAPAPAPAATVAPPRIVPARPYTVRPSPARRAKVRSVMRVLRRLRAERLALATLPALPRVMTPSAAVPQVPEEGVVVVSTGGAPAGGGGALDDLVRGRATPLMRPCAGLGHDLTAISGVVPDGVGQAFLTSPDGTAIKADVTDNGYSFLVAPLSTPAPRYVVWLKDGLPHVQALPYLGGRIRCPASGRVLDGIEITPNGLTELAPGIGLPVLPSIVEAMPVPRTVTALPAIPRLLKQPRKR